LFSIKGTFDIFIKFGESFSLGSLLNQSQTYQGNPCGVYPDLSSFTGSGVIQISIACIKRSAPRQDHIIWYQSFGSWYRFYLILFFFFVICLVLVLLFAFLFASCFVLVWVLLCSGFLSLFCYLFSCLCLVVFLFVSLFHSCSCSCHIFVLLVSFRLWVKKNLFEFCFKLKKKVAEILKKKREEKKKKSGCLIFKHEIEVVRGIFFVWQVCYSNLFYSIYYLIYYLICYLSCLFYLLSKSDLLSKSKFVIQIKSNLLSKSSLICYPNQI